MSTTSPISLYLLYFLPKCAAKYNKYARSFTVSAAKAWNTLPNNIRASATVCVFKTPLETHLFKAYFEWYMWTFLGHVLDCIHFMTLTNVLYYFIIIIIVSTFFRNFTLSHCCALNWDCLKVLEVFWFVCWCCCCCFYCWGYCYFAFQLCLHTRQECVCVWKTRIISKVYSDQKWFIATILLEHCAFAIGTLRLRDWCIATTFGAFRHWGILTIIRPGLETHPPRYPHYNYNFV